MSRTLEPFHQSACRFAVQLLAGHLQTNIVPPPMIQPPAVSVLMPVYNAERYLAAAIRSMLDQTLREFELLILDDGSTDGSPAIIKSFAEQDPRIRATFLEHAGLVALLNRGIEQARAPLIARMDADDVSLPRRLRTQVDYLLSHPDCVALGAAVQWIDPQGWPICTYRPPTAHEQIEQDLLRGYGQAITHPVATFRLDALRQVGGYRHEYDMAEDLDLFLRLAEVGRLANLDDVLLQFRRHVGSVSHSRHQHQSAVIGSVLAEARSRRGLPPAPAFNRFEPPADRPELAFHLAWSLRAARAGHWLTSCKHVLPMVAHPLATARLMSKALVHRCRHGRR